MKNTVGVLGPPRARASTSKYYSLALLTLILAFNYVDRFALGVLLQDIKVDLHLSDTQLGLLTGIAFALFYAVMGIPIARWADRGNRVTIIAVTAALWSFAVASCAAAANFVQLMFMRMGVAVGEAGCYPPALSLISDYFERGERPRAVSRYMLGIPLALLIGYAGAGWLDEYFGWRSTFLILGIPGVVLATVAALTLKEPRRERTCPSEAVLAGNGSSQISEPSLKEVFCALWANRAFRNIFLCFSVWGFFGYGVMQWMPAFFLRSYGLATGVLGTWLAVVNGLGGLLGTWLGGELASRYAANNERLQLLAIAFVYVVLAVVGAAVYLVPTSHLAFAMLAVSAVAGAATNGPLFAATQTLVPPRMRAMSIALMYFFCNLVGMGLGPLAVGAMSDAMRPWLGQEALRYSLLAFSPGYLWCAWHLWRASHTLSQDVAVSRGQTPLSI
jgi:MFS transporter, Spinster family, sphingosine-1-phosphate transporter